jgi:hypothetical protein
MSSINIQDDLINLTNRLEFLLNSSYSLMYLNADENGEITKNDVSGFYLSSEIILNDLKNISSKLKNIEK